MKKIFKDHTNVNITSINFDEYLDLGAGVKIKCGISSSLKEVLISDDGKKMMGNFIVTLTGFNETMDQLLFSLSLRAGVEAEIKDDIIIATISNEDLRSAIIKLSNSELEEIIWNILKNTKYNSIKLKLGEL